MKPSETGEAAVDGLEECETVVEDGTRAEVSDSGCLAAECGKAA